MATKLFLLVVLVAALVSSSLQARISLFDHSGHRNHVGDVEVNGCYTMPAWQNKKVSSVNTHGHCFYLYEHGECNGARVTISNGGGDCPDHGQLSRCNFNDRATSIGTC